MKELNIARLQNDEEYFENQRLNLADELMKHAEGPMSALDALDLAQDRLLALIWG
ncbi:MAG: hypothetical protein LC650_03885 [Actinobacteria bacterium]|nr:hypothetical protein [Actinomycetota bacterium]